MLECSSDLPFYRPQQSWGKIIFFHVSVILFTGGGLGGIPACIAGGIQHALQQVSGVVSQHALQVSGPIPMGKLRGICQGVSRPTPKGESEGHLARGSLQAHTQGEVEGDLGRGLQAHTWESIPACTEADPPRWLLWMVCILLECILVYNIFLQ